MTVPVIPAAPPRIWTIAGTAALALHLAIGALVLAWSRLPATVEEEPVVLIELPPLAAPAAPADPAQPSDPQQPQAKAPNMPVPPIELPPVNAPLQTNPVILPPPPQAQPQPQARPAAQPAPSLAAPSVPAASGPTNATGNDPKARQQEANYFAMVSAHLNRRKVYPPEARKARQQGVVTVRFTVDRAGNISNVSIKRSSGHEVLDQATLDLVRRVAPLPRFPSSIQRDSITLSLPIDYSLRTS